MKYPIKIASAMAAYYAVTGVYQNYISKYFGAQGLTDGEIIAMPGLPKVPAAENIDVDENGVISGLF